LSVVIEGETGAGKELIAAALHEHSNRAAKPFVVFDCSAFPATLLESEIFGHEKGAFSGASHRHRGVFERADGGTIFFDELGEMDIEFQSKFLRVLESGEVRRVGGESVFKVDVRVVAATNRNLEDLVEEKKFRQDLFYRLAKVRFILPPLRERPEDIPLLAEHFLNQLAGEETARPLMTEDALRTLQAYRWPGNIRQLRNVIEKAVAMCSGGAITAEYLRGELNMGGSPRPTMASATTPALPSNTLSPAPTMITTTHTKRLMVNLETAIADDAGEAIPFKDAKDALVEQFEKIYLERLLSRNRQNVSKTAREAQIDRRHLYRLLKKHELMDED
jgi:DNA-binding NtrC family response regulator